MSQEGGQSVAEREGNAGDGDEKEPGGGREVTCPKEMCCI